MPRSSIRDPRRRYVRGRPPRLRFRWRLTARGTRNGRGRRVRRAVLLLAGVAILVVAGTLASSILLHDGPLSAYLGPDDGPGRSVVDPPAIDGGWYAAAPYVMPLAGSPPDLVDVMKTTGQKTFQLSFILARGSECSPAWDGTAPVGPDNRVAGAIDALRDNGGDVSVAFGGGLGTRLGQVCRDAEATAAAYREVIDRYRLRSVDFDLEDPEWRDDDAVARELGAAAILKRDLPGLYLTLTLPMLQTTVPSRAVHVLEVAHSLGLAPDNVTVMPFNFHGQAPMSAAAIDALEAMHGQLMQTFGWSAEAAWQREGASLMNGRTDHGEFFTTDDFQAVLDFGRSNALGRFTYWSLNRDRQCAVPDNGGKTSGTCSSVAQEPLEFTRFTAAFGASVARRGGAAPLTHLSR